MLRGARGRAAIARGARIAAFAVSAAAALWVASLAAEPDANGRLVGTGAGAGTMDEALIQSYQNNPQLNSQRSATRAIDENVPTALAGYRPRVSGTASLTDQYLDQLTRTTGTTAGIPATYTQAKGAFAVQSYGLTATQTLYNGFQTASRTRQAEGQVFSARETLRTTEQNVLLSAATAYMNLLQTAAILELQRSNVNVLEVTLRQTRDRFTAGGHAHRRSAGGIAALRRPIAAVAGGIELRHSASAVPASDRRAAAGPARACAPGRSALAAHARGRHRPRAHRASFDHDRDVQRRHRAPAGQDRRGRACSHLGRGRQRAEELRQRSVAGGARDVAGFDRRPAHGADLSGRSRILRHPASQGDARTTPARSRHCARPGAGHGDPGLGSARRRQGANRRHPIAGHRRRGRAQRRARGGARGPTHHARRAQLAADLVNARVALVTAQRDRIVASYYTLLAATGALSPQ